MIFACSITLSHSLPFWLQRRKVLHLGCSQSILCSWVPSNRDFTQPEKVIRGTNKRRMTPSLKHWMCWPNASQVWFVTGLTAAGADTALAITDETVRRNYHPRGRREVIIYPLCWFYHLELRSIRHIDPDLPPWLVQSTSNDKIKLLTCFIVLLWEINKCVTENTRFPLSLHPENWGRSQPSGKYALAS